MAEMKAELEQLLLHECCAIYLAMKTEAAQSDDGIDYGIFPASAIIIRKNGFHPKFFGLGKPVRTWRYDGTTLTELPETPERNRNDYNKMYYRVAEFTFSFPDDLSVARVAMSLGPRYGIGLLYTIEKDDGNIALGQRTTEWVS